eukprot:TRINITY_DN16846_c0_g1_i1.p3 TRINITY_DN16846_c0_g1~~TRINITY_DN16846_c0_g1_i1.p3  ORF type:complete len:371 (+),score=107.53 TRINITY_DN16846_c0_g1_i1:861-1973(+)
MELLEVLRDWAGQQRFSAAAALRVADAQCAAAERAIADGADPATAKRSALRARLYALSLQGHWTDAEQLQALAAECEQLYGGEDTITADALHWCGECLCNYGEWHKALPPLRRALDMRSQALGEDHRDTLVTQRWLGNALVHASAVEEGRRMLVGSRSAFRRKEGPDSVEAKKCLGALAGVHLQRKEQDEALVLYEEQLSGLERALGPEHPDSLMAAYCIGCTMTLGRPEDARWGEALPFLRRAYHGWSQVLAQGHLRATMAAQRYAYALCAAAADPEARKEAKRRAEAVLRAVGLWKERQELAKARRAKLRSNAGAGEARRGLGAGSGQEAGQRHRPAVRAAGLGAGRPEASQHDRDGKLQERLPGGHC